MFLKVATVLAILGLSLSLLLSLIQQAVFVGRFYSSSMMLLFRVMSFTETAAMTIPLIIFFVAFLLSTKTKPIEGPTK